MMIVSLFFALFIFCSKSDDASFNLKSPLVILILLLMLSTDIASCCDVSRSDVALSFALTELMDINNNTNIKTIDMNFELIFSPPHA